MLSVEKTLKQEIAQLKHEYEVLDACCELAQGKIAELKAENDRLKEEKDGMQILIDNYIALTEKYQQVLQEIKKIANYWQRKLLYDADERMVFDVIIDLITKAEVGE